MISSLHYFSGDAFPLILCKVQFYAARMSCIFAVKKESETENGKQLKFHYRNNNKSNL